MWLSEFDSPKGVSFKAGQPEAPSGSPEQGEAWAPPPLKTYRQLYPSVSNFQLPETEGTRMPRSCQDRKINREKVLASLDKVCPKCGGLISPAEVRRIDFKTIECPVCGERFVPGSKR